MDFEFGKYPLEVFGHVYTDTTTKAINDRDAQYCPFLDSECKKPRKSEPEIKVGICTLGYRIDNAPTIDPVVICPYRFLEKTIFDSIKQQFFPRWRHSCWIKEVLLDKFGHIDYVAMKLDNSKRPTGDFYCIEFQACGTTGSPYPYVKELLENHKYSGRTYTYGLNWANEFMKTMMQQVLKKGSVIDYWGKKIIFVIQDVAMQYIKGETDTSQLRQNEADPIHFLTFKMDYNNTTKRLELAPHEWASTNVQGVRQMLAGKQHVEYPSVEAFINNAYNKGKKDGTIK